MSKVNPKALMFLVVPLSGNFGFFLKMKCLPLVVLTTLTFRPSDFTISKVLSASVPSSTSTTTYSSFRMPAYSSLSSTSSREGSVSTPLNFWVGFLLFVGT